MKDVTVRNSLGVLLISVHLVIIALLFGGYLLHGLSFDQMTTAIAVVAPISAAYVGIVVKTFLQATPRRSAPKDVAGTFVFTVFSFPIAFSVFLISVILMFVLNKAFDTFEEFKIALALGETLFGVYITKIVAALFPKHSP